MVELGILSDVVFNMGFLFALAATTLIIWVLMKVTFGHDSFAHAFVIAVLSILFLPTVIQSLQVGSAFILILVLGALALSTYYDWSLSASFILVLLGLISAMIIFPQF